MTKYHNYPDNILLEEIIKSNSKAFEEIYNRYWYKLFSVAYHQLGSKEDAEQIVHDVFEKLWTKKENLTITNLGVYLVVSAKNGCINFIKSQLTFRKYQEYLMFHEVYHTENADNISSPEELTELIEKILTTLPEKTAMVFKMSKFENQPNKAISAKLQLSEKAVEYHITKSFKHIKENLKGYYSAN